MFPQIMELQILSQYIGLNTLLRVFYQHTQGYFQFMVEHASEIYSFKRANNGEH